MGATAQLGAGSMSRSRDAPPRGLFRSPHRASSCKPDAQHRITSILPIQELSEGLLHPQAVRARLRKQREVAPGDHVEMVAVEYLAAEEEVDEGRVEAPDGDAVERPARRAGSRPRTLPGAGGVGGGTAWDLKPPVREGNVALDMEAGRPAGPKDVHDVVQRRQDRTRSGRRRGPVRRSARRRGCGCASGASSSASSPLTRRLASTRSSLYRANSAPVSIRCPGSWHRRRSGLVGCWWARHFGRRVSTEGLTGWRSTPAPVCCPTPQPRIHRVATPIG